MLTETIQTQKAIEQPTEIDLLISDLQKMLAASPSDEQRKDYESKLKQAEKLQIKYIEILKKLKLYKDTHGAEYFKPLPHQQQIFDFYFAGKKTLLLQGGNQLGKTHCGINFIQANCLGYLPWDKEKKTLFATPIKVRVICCDWDHHASEVIIPKLYQNLIFDEMVKLGNDGWGKKNQVGVESFFQYKNGSTIELMTSKLNKQAYEGWTGHIIWGDEPFPKFIYDACVRGLSEANGITLFTLTSVDSDYDWILEDIIESPNEEMQKTVGAVRGVHSYANTYISKANFDRVSLGWDENTRKARLEGGWYSGQGKVWDKFNYDLHVCDEFKIPTDWPVTPMIDFHPCIEQAIGFYAVDKPGWKYVVDEVWEHLSAEEIADEIIRRKTQGWRIDVAYIDPYSKGDNKMMTNRMPHLQDAYTVIKDRLSKPPHGIRLEVALKDKSSGIVNIKNWLMGANKMPSLKIFRKCKRHIYEMKKWEKDENGMPSDKDDHMCENIYRYSLTGTVWTDITLFNRKVEFPATAVA